MQAYQRLDGHMAQVVNAGLKIDIFQGCVTAWIHMRGGDVPREVILRVLSQDGPRRDCGTEPEKAPDAAQAKATAIRPFPLPRNNHELAALIDHAIQLMAVRNRHYAEALLRIYSVDTPTVMRVLFNPRRRRAASRRPRMAALRLEAAA
ncbi:hypothetical protein MJ904_15080 [Massilia sp. MB5]|uniref:hypothetical protein n=1 Tax=Massilia sp. MB5 TaxID=2919578 RepID=UPI001F0F7B43|nr:hypothetical protein [Massilia sp. MB5]UMR28482.1 hypothetical protein MJ904_15080 [Massilia sp. MB5]